MAFYVWKNISQPCTCSRLCCIGTRFIRLLSIRASPFFPSDFVVDCVDKSTAHWRDTRQNGQKG